jgi:prepilin-type N-terminal cleavage/methylation domain-containing protein
MPLFPTSFIVRAYRARRQDVFRRGVTLIETLIAITVAAMASSALLLAVQASLGTSIDSVDRALAEGIAQQLVDEIAQKLYMTTGDTPLSTQLGPSSGEAAGPGRSRFNDIDDYHQFTACPLQGVYGERLGTGDDAGALRPTNFRLPNGFFERWREKVSIYYVDPTTLQRLASGTSYYRCIEVTIEQQDATGAFVPLATKRRVIAYVPS